MSRTTTLELRSAFRLGCILATVTGLVLLGPTAKSARAGLVTTETALHAAPEPDAARARLAELVDRPDVARELERLGVDADEAHARIAALSDAEVAEIAGRIDELPAGGDVVGAVLGVALIVFLVLLLTDILGLTDVFPFVKKPANR